MTTTIGLKVACYSHSCDLASTGPTFLHSRHAPLRRIYRRTWATRRRQPFGHLHRRPLIDSASWDRLPICDPSGAHLRAFRAATQGDHGQRRDRQRDTDAQGGTFHPSRARQCLKDGYAAPPSTRLVRRHPILPLGCSRRSGRRERRKRRVEGRRSSVGLSLFDRPPQPFRCHPP